MERKYIFIMLSRALGIVASILFMTGFSPVVKRYRHKARPPTGGNAQN